MNYESNSKSTAYRLSKSSSRSLSFYLKLIGSHSAVLLLKKLQKYLIFLWHHIHLSGLAVLFSAINICIKPVTRIKFSTTCWVGRVEPNYFKSSLFCSVGVEIVFSDHFRKQEPEFWGSAGIFIGKEVEEPWKLRMREISDIEAILVHFSLPASCWPSQNTTTRIIPSDGCNICQTWCPPPSHPLKHKI